MSALDDEIDYTSVFDHFYTNNHIQIFKSLLPFFDNGSSSFLPVLIKYLELQHTIALVKKGTNPFSCDIMASDKQTPDLAKIYQIIKKYLSPEEDNSIQQIGNMMQTFENVKEMQKMMDLFQSMNGTENGSGFESMMNGFPMNGDFNMEEMMQLFKNMNN